MKTVRTIERQLFRGAAIRTALRGVAAGLWLYLISGQVASGQGTVLFNNDVPGVVVTHVYAPLASNPYLSQVGNGSTDFPAGATSWAGFTRIGTNGLSGQYGGATTLAQLLAGPDAGSLLPESPVTTFRTGAAAGFVAPVTVTVNNVGPGGVTVIDMVAWDNSSGLYSTWTTASQAWVHGLISAGHSGGLVVTFGGTSVSPGLTGLQSFNLFMVPEPSTFALAGLGLATLLMFLRSK